jgi:ribosomal protein L2
LNLKKKFILLAKKKIFKKLISNSKITRSAGRNFTGKKTIRGRGYKNKKKRRVIDYFRSL